MNKDFQPTLLSEEVYRSLEKPQIRGPLLFTTIDSTPSYRGSAIMDEVKLSFGNSANLKFSVPSYPTTPLDLIQSHDQYFHMAQTADSIKRGIESVGALRLGNNDINVMIDSPIKSIAWTLFLKTTEQLNAKDAHISINLSKAIIERINKVRDESGVLKTETIYIIKIIDSREYKGKEFSHFNKLQMKFLRSRVKIFNGCLETSAKMFANITGKEVVFTS